MKKILLCIFSILFTVNIYAEKIEKFEYIISVNTDKSLHIVENIDYNPENEFHHGIIRDIITKNSSYKLLKFDDRIAIKNFKSNFKTKIQERSEYISYRLGSSNSYLPINEISRFTLEYDIYNVVRTNEDTFQIYLNATGNFWDMPIENVEIKLDVKPSAIKKTYVYTGFYGENTNNYIVKNSNTIINRKVLQENEGITFKLNLDKNVYSYTLKDKIRNVLETYPTIKINIFISIIGIILIVLSILKKNKNKDNIPITPEFMLDEKISPAMCYKINGKSSYDMLTIVFLSLVSKGLIKEKNRVEDIEYVIKKGDKIPDNDIDYNQTWEREKEKVYSLIETTKIENALTDKNLLSLEEKQVLINFYRYKEDVFSSYSNIANLNVETQKLVDKIYRTNLGKKSIIYQLMSMIILFALIVSNMIFLNLFEINTFIISTVIMGISLIVSFNILILTEEGKKAYRNVKGFLMYFEKVETNIFKTLKTEKEIISYAKKMLPYAVAVGIEAKFIDLLNKELSVRNIAKASIYPYIYYPYFLNRHIINNEINDLIRENTRIQNANARHSSGGGFSGGSGGFSGGGFSGGGGSSW